MIVNLIDKLKSDGTLDILLKHGIISSKVYTYREMYLYYKAELIENNAFKDCKMLSITRTSDKFKVDQATIYRAIKTMEA